MPVELSILKYESTDDHTLDQRQILQKFMTESGASNAQYQQVAVGSPLNAISKNLRRFEMTPTHAPGKEPSFGPSISTGKVKLFPISKSPTAANKFIPHQLSLAHRPSKPTSSV